LPLILGIVGGVLVLCIAATVALVALSNAGNQGQTNTTPTATTGPAATTTPAETVVYSNALTTASEGWNTGSNCGFKSDGYHINGSFICYAPTNPVGDGTITVTAKQLSGPTDSAYGIVFRRASKGNYYAFEVDGGGHWIFYKTINGTASTINDFKLDPAIKTGLNAGNVLQVHASGTSFAFSVNGTQVGSATDTTFSSGLVGLDGNTGLDVVYSNIKVTKPAA
jgi:hypothetical protein